MSLRTSSPPTEIVYPDSDGEPMSDNTLQFEWIVTIKEGLGAVFKDDPNVFVAGDLLWYPVEGDNATRAAPDAMVALGRPKGYRGSYRQWVEGGIAPQVVFEVLSPGNRAGAMTSKRAWYERFGVQEYYVYDPDDIELTGWRREGDSFEEISEMNGWTSPLLGIRFEPRTDTLVIYDPAGRPFQTYLELVERVNEVTEERDAERQRAEAERRKVERLMAQLRDLGIEPNP